MGRSVRRLSHGTRATSDELYGTVLSTSAGDTGTAVAAGVATGVHTALTVAKTQIVAATAIVAATVIVTTTANLAEEPAVTSTAFVAVTGIVARTGIVTTTARARAGLIVAAGNKQRHGWSRKRNGRGGAGETDQPSSHPEPTRLWSSRRRSRAPPASPAIATRASAVSGSVSTNMSAFSRWEKRSASASGGALWLFGSLQPLAAESRTRWTSERRACPDPRRPALCGCLIRRPCPQRI